MFAHVSIGVSDLNKSVNFYDVTLKKLGVNRLFGSIDEGFMAYGAEDAFFIVCLPILEDEKVQASNGTHICLKAPSKKSVDDFYTASMQMGAKDCGAPGIRKHYAEDYYAAFIHDLDGHKIEVLARVK